MVFKKIMIIADGKAEACKGEEEKKKQTNKNPEWTSGYQELLLKSIFLKQERHVASVGIIPFILLHVNALVMFAKSAGSLN